MTKWVIERRHLEQARALAQLNAGLVDASYERRLANLARPDLLILDDFGLKPLRAPAPEHLYDLIATRYEKGFDHHHV